MNDEATSQDLHDWCTEVIAAAERLTAVYNNHPRKEDMGAVSIATLLELFAAAIDANVCSRGLHTYASSLAADNGVAEALDSALQRVDDMADDGVPMLEAVRALFGAAHKRRAMFAADVARRASKGAEA